MNNGEIKLKLKECRIELQDIKKILSEHSKKFNKISIYLTNYAIIKACSTIEFSYKNLIADYFDKHQNKYIKYFINKKIRLSSSNPSMSKINEFIKYFDDDINKKFKDNLNGIDKTKCNNSLNKLREARNKIAHGDNITLTINRIIEYYVDSKNILIKLDETLIYRKQIETNILNAFNNLFNE